MVGLVGRRVLRRCSRCSRRAIAPYDPLQTSWSAIRKAPSRRALFGTDEIGRDVLSRVICGARASLLAGLVSVCISLSLGVPIGLLAGYVGRLARRADLAHHRRDARHARS